MITKLTKIPFKEEKNFCNKILIGKNMEYYILSPSKEIRPRISKQTIKAAIKPKSPIQTKIYFLDTNHQGVN